MTRCKMTTKGGKPCRAAAAESGYCGLHNPAHGKARALGRKRGGERRRVPHVADPAQVKTPIRDVAGVMTLLDVATLDTLALENGAQRTRAIVGLALAYLKALEIGELETRLELIEKALGGGDHDKH